VLHEIGRKDIQTEHDANFLVSKDLAREISMLFMK
jgi:hypothetical protein